MVTEIKPWIHVESYLIEGHSLDSIALEDSLVSTRKHINGPNIVKYYPYVHALFNLTLKDFKDSGPPLSLVNYEVLNKYELLSLLHFRDEIPEEV